MQCYYYKMEKHNVDDIFEDFEHKVEGKKHISEKPKRDLSDDELLKRKYGDAERDLKEKYKREKRILEEKRTKEMPESSNIPTKNIPNIERFAYLAIILILVAIVGFNIFQGSDDAQAITANVVEEEVETEETVEEQAEEEVVEPSSESLSSILTIFSKSRFLNVFGTKLRVPVYLSPGLIPIA